METRTRQRDNIIRRARLAKGWTVEQLAKVVQLPAKTILFYESDLYTPSRVALARIGAALGETLDGSVNAEPQYRGARS
jgi:ribosome-binding protein aMBF1 (putative translation factor)